MDKLIINGMAVTSTHGKLGRLGRIGEEISNALEGLAFANSQIDALFREMTDYSSAALEAENMRLQAEVEDYRNNGRYLVEEKLQADLEQKALVSSLEEEILRLRSKYEDPIDMSAILDFFNEGDN